MQLLLAVHRFVQFALTKLAARDELRTAFIVEQLNIGAEQSAERVKRSGLVRCGDTWPWPHGGKFGSRSGVLQ